MLIKLKPMPLEFLSNGKHVHLLSGSEVPGCTSVAKLFDDKGWMCPWAAKMAVEYVDKNLTSIEQKAIVLKEAKTAWRKKRDTAGAKGTSAHEILEKYIKAKISGIPFDLGLFSDPEVNSAVQNFLQWESENHVEWLASEVHVGSLVNGFAGILDFLAVVNGVETLGDFKTSSGIRAEAYIQTAGLWI